MITLKIFATFVAFTVFLTITLRFIYTKEDDLPQKVAVFFGSSLILTIISVFAVIMEAVWF